MSHIQLGRYNQLEVVKEVDFGMYLNGDEDGEILLPKRYVPQGCKPGDVLKHNIMIRWATGSINGLKRIHERR